ncbi:hypothetical protein [Aegicerativicinus sediminis]|uniref:hypothetical protein n=1 Tax=Aegicerativicinus sediminis TaxID=2893202 RepID=UPI001E498921|nr:hypothetical protein [Aegicerativicinus sediminis]
MIVFDQSLSTTKHLWVFNKNIIKFHDDGGNTPTFADIVCTEFVDRIYPDPNDGIFTFDFRKHLKALAVQNDLADMVDLDMGAAVADLVHDDTSEVKYDISLDITINFSDADPVTINKNYTFLVGAEQLIDYQRQESPQLGLFMLQVPKERQKTEYFVNYWEGYPFDISIYSITSGNMNILNQSNGMDIDVPIPGGAIINRIAFSDAVSNLTIADYLPLKTGINKLQITRPGYDPGVHLNESPLTVYINRIESDCGVYVKFRNNWGGWSYWLFNKRKSVSLDARGLESIANDFNNIENTISPIKYSGVEESFETLNCIARRVTAQDMRILRQIIESPKVYLFTGEPYSINKSAQPNQWVEIECLNRSLKVEEPGRMFNDVKIDLGLPFRTNATLL